MWETSLGIDALDDKLVMTTVRALTILYDNSLVHAPCIWASEWLRNSENYEIAVHSDIMFYIAVS